MTVRSVDAHGTDRQSKVCKSNPPLDPKLQQDKNFSPSEQVGTLGCRIMAQDTSQLTSDAQCSDSQSKACKSYSPVISHEESKRIFFYHSKFECLKVSSGSPIHCMRPQTDLALTGCRSCSNGAHPNPKIVQQDKFFASRHVRMSGCRIEPCDMTVRSVDAHGTDRQSKVCKSNPPLDPKLQQDKNFSPSEQVGTLGCRIMAQDTSQLTSDAQCSDSQSTVCKSNPPVCDSPSRIETKNFPSQHVRMLWGSSGSPIHCMQPQIYLAFFIV